MNAGIGVALVIRQIFVVMGSGEMAETIVLCTAWVTTCVAVIVAHFKVTNPVFPFCVFAFPTLLTYTYLTRG